MIMKIMKVCANPIKKKQQSMEVKIESIHSEILKDSNSIVYSYFV